MDDDLWKDFLASYSDDGMWLLNKLFLEYVMSKNCIFVLTKNPSLYYDGKKSLIYRKYSQELEHIYGKEDIIGTQVILKI